MNPNKIFTAQSVTVFLYKDLARVELHLDSLARLVIDYTGPGAVAVFKHKDANYLEIQKFFSLSDTSNRLKSPGIWRWEGTIGLDVIQNKIISVNGKWTLLDGKAYEHWSRVS